MSDVFSVTDLANQLQQCSQTPLLDMRYFLSEILQRPIAEIFHEVRLTSTQVQTLDLMISRRLQYEPVAYILGKTSFWGLDFTVNPSVLIPRADTECLVETVLSQHDHGPKRVADLGTGSGAIALSLAHERPQWVIQGIDVCPQAIAVAKVNATQHRVESAQVSFSCRSWHDPMLLPPGGTDIVVSNPPYIDSASTEVCRSTALFEPKKALYSADKGLFDLHCVVTLSNRCLINSGRVYLEHGYDQGSQVRTILAENGYVSIETVLDYTGHERLTWGIKYDALDGFSKKN